MVPVKEGKYGYFYKLLYIEGIEINIMKYTSFKDEWPF